MASRNASASAWVPKASPIVCCWSPASVRQRARSIASAAGFGITPTARATATTALGTFPVAGSVSERVCANLSSSTWFTQLGVKRQ